MEAFTHRFVTTNGISTHFVEMGSGPTVLLLHGFPETWYSWRHQIVDLAQAGFHVVAPDLRGYGQTDVPIGVEKYTALHIVGDIIGLLDELAVPQAFVIGHDWGAVISWYLCLFRPDRILAHVALSVYFIPRTPGGSIVQQMRAAFGERHYIVKFQEPGRVEAEVARASPEGFLRHIFSSFKPVVDDDIVPTDAVNTPLPPWISDEDIKCYADDFSKNGITGPLNYYRASDRTWELMAPWTKGKVIVPTLYIVGDRDLVYEFPGAKDYIHNGGLNADVPNLKNTIILEGVGHFLQEEKPQLVNGHILEFLRSFP